MQRIDRLPILILYPHSRCNCRCVMCDIWKIDRVQELRAEDLARIAGDIESLGVRWAVLSGGEPLMHSDLSGFCSVLRSRGIRITLLTSGLLLAKKAAVVAATIEDVTVSLDGPPAIHDLIRRVPRAYELLASGVRALRAEMPDMPVAARCTVQRANHLHLRETVETAANLGLRSVSFLAADLTSRAFNRPEGWSPERTREVALDAQDAGRLEDEVEKLIEELPERPGFVLEPPEKLRRIVRHFRAHLGLAEPVAPPCNAPWVSAVIESDGTVRPCFFHRAIGNIRRQSLREVLNGPEATAFRSALDIPGDPICRRCVCSLHVSRDT